MTAPDGSPEFWVDRFIRSLGEKTSRAFAFAGGLTAYEMVLRYFFKAPTPWLPETPSPPTTPPAASSPWPVGARSGRGPASVVSRPGVLSESSLNTLRAP